MNSKIKKEIERKFLVRKFPKNFRKFPHALISQGYLCLDPNGSEVRLRKRGKKCFLTVKHGAGTVRDELEIRLNKKKFARLWEMTRGRRLYKIRYDIPEGDLTVEVDVYQGQNKGLVVAEIEFPDEQSCKKFKPLEWLGKDVSGNPRYRNRNLAVE